jgi:hypothetical protein
MKGGCFRIDEIKNIAYFRHRAEGVEAGEFVIPFTKNISP